MLTDRFGLAVTTTSPAARDAYVEACDLILTLYPGAVAAFDRAIAAGPGFALAHAGRARALQAGGRMAEAQASIATAQTLSRGLPDREASHIAIFALLVAGQPAEALQSVRRHAAAWPRDVLVANTAANQTGLIGTSGLAGREQDQLDFLAGLAPHYDGDWWFNGHYGMALSELGHHAAARPLLERSIAEQPRNATAAHAYAHFLYETGDAGAATAFLRDWLAVYPRQGGLHGHLNWHLALVHLHQGDVATGLQLYTDAFAAETYYGPALVKLLDAPSFLWRAELAGHPCDLPRWQALRDFTRMAFPRPGIAFADWHAALIDAALGDADAVEARATELEALIGAGRYPAGPAVPAAIRGFAAFQRQDYPATIAALAPMLAERERLPGSRAQLDLLEFTLLRALSLSGHADDASRLLAARRPGPQGIPVAGFA